MNLVSGLGTVLLTWADSEILQAYPFLLISIYLTVESSKGVAVEKWLIVGWLCLTFTGIILT